LSFVMFLFFFTWGYLEHMFIKLTQVSFSFFKKYFFIELCSFLLGSFLIVYFFLFQFHIAGGLLVKLTLVNSGFFLRHYFFILSFSIKLLNFEFCSFFFFFKRFISISYLESQIIKVNLNWFILSFYFFYTRKNLTRL